MLLGRQLRSETQRRIKVGALCVLLAAFAWLALSAAVFMGVVGTALLTFVIWKMTKERRTADDSIRTHPGNTTSALRSSKNGRHLAPRVPRAGGRHVDHHR